MNSAFHEAILYKQRQKIEGRGMEHYPPAALLLLLEAAYGTDYLHIIKRRRL